MSEKNKGETYEDDVKTIENLMNGLTDEQFCRVANEELQRRRSERIIAYKKILEEENNVETVENLMNELTDEQFSELISVANEERQRRITEQNNSIRKILEVGMIVSHLLTDEPRYFKIIKKNRTRAICSTVIFDDEEKTYYETNKKYRIYFKHLQKYDIPMEFKDKNQNIEEELAKFSVSSSQAKNSDKNNEKEDTVLDVNTLVQYTGREKKYRNQDFKLLKKTGKMATVAPVNSPEDTKRFNLSNLSPSPKKVNNTASCSLNEEDSDEDTIYSYDYDDDDDDDNDDDEDTDDDDASFEGNKEKIVGLDGLCKNIKNAIPEEYKHIDPKDRLQEAIASGLMTQLQQYTKNYFDEFERQNPEKVQEMDFEFQKLLAQKDDDDDDDGVISCSLNEENGGGRGGNSGEDNIASCSLSEDNLKIKEENHKKYMTDEILNEMINGYLPILYRLHDGEYNPFAMTCDYTVYNERKDTNGDILFSYYVKARDEEYEYEYFFDFRVLREKPKDNGLFYYCAKHDLWMTEEKVDFEEQFEPDFIDDDGDEEDEVDEDDNSGSENEITDVKLTEEEEKELRQAIELDQALTAFEENNKDVVVDSLQRKFTEPIEELSSSIRAIEDFRNQQVLEFRQNHTEKNRVYIKTNYTKEETMFDDNQPNLPDNKSNIKGSFKQKKIIRPDYEEKGICLQYFKTFKQTQENDRNRKIAVYNKNNKTIQIFWEQSEGYKKYNHIWKEKKKEFHKNPNFFFGHLVLDKEIVFPFSDHLSDFSNIITSAQKRSYNVFVLEYYKKPIQMGINNTKTALQEVYYTGQAGYEVFFKIFKKGLLNFDKIFRKITNIVDENGRGIPKKIQKIWNRIWDEEEKNISLIKGIRDGQIIKKENTIAYERLERQNTIEELERLRTILLERNLTEEEEKQLSLLLSGKDLPLQQHSTSTKELLNYITELITILNNIVI
jgi:hypothetical protein